jgi:branched-chain amino acid transport system substrate-binding protein
VERAEYFGALRVIMNKGVSFKNMKGEIKMLKLDHEKKREARSIRKVCLRIFALILLSVCLVGFSTMAGAAEKGPIKIGFIAPHTGNFAQLGMDMVAGFKMFLEEIDYTVAGRKIELIVEDEGEGPATAVVKARKLIAADKIHLLAGVFLNPSTYAVAAICLEAGIPFIVTASGNDELTQRKRSKLILGLTYTGSDLGHPAGDYAYNQLGWRKAVVVGWDFGFGYEVVGGFQRVFEDAGGKVIQKIWAPLNTMDFSPYVASLKRDADGIFEVITGSSSVRFIRALRMAGLMNKWKVVAAGTATDEWVLPALGDSGIGVYSTYNWSAVLQTPENKIFVDKVHKQLKKEATVGMSTNYTGADWITRAIKAINGDIENKDKFLQAMRSIEIPNSIRGPLKIDDYGHATQNIYIRRIDKVDNNYQNTVVHTYPNVSQFWKYNPETYLKSPAYSRDFPPCKYCD